MQERGEKNRNKISSSSLAIRLAKVLRSGQKAIVRLHSLSCEPTDTQTHPRPASIERARPAAVAGCRGGGGGGGGRWGGVVVVVDVIIIFVVFLCHITYAMRPKNAIASETFNNAKN